MGRLLDDRAIGDVAHQCFRRKRRRLAFEARIAVARVPVGDTDLRAHVPHLFAGCIFMNLYKVEVEPEQAKFDFDGAAF